MSDLKLIDNVDDKPAANSASPEPAKQTLDDVVKALPDPVTQDKPATQTMAPREEQSIPEKYRGKSAAEIIQMHQNAESLLGKQSSEVGELRSIVDDFIKSQNTSKSTNPNEPVEDEIDFLDDPETAMNRAIEKHPDVRDAKELKADRAKEKALNAVLKRHPDIPEVLANEDFLKWIGGSAYRTRTFKQANETYDVDAADEIFGTWKELQASNKTTDDTSSTDDAVKAEQRRNTADAKTGVVNQGGGESKKIYRRSDIVNLMITDRPRYEALEGEIQLAYKEGRVR